MGREISELPQSGMSHRPQGKATIFLIIAGLAFPKNMSRLGSFLRLSAADRWLALEAAACLGLARAAVTALPFSWIATILRGQEIISGPHGEPDTPSTRVSQAFQVALAVRRMSRHTPWRSNCLAKAIAGRLMLHRRRIASTVYFGMARQRDGEMTAHAWLKSGEMTLTGGSNLDRYAIVAIFSQKG